jgi:hypothetical protein
MDMILSAAKKATESAKKSAKHAIEIAGMANTAARTMRDHDFVTGAMQKAAAAVDEFHVTNALHEAAKIAASNGEHHEAAESALQAVNASTNAASLAHSAAMDAGSAGAPEKIVDLVTSHATDAHVNGVNDRTAIEDRLGY